MIVSEFPGSPREGVWITAAHVKNIVKWMAPSHSCAAFTDVAIHNWPETDKLRICLADAGIHFVSALRSAGLVRSGRFY